MKNEVMTVPRGGLESVIRRGILSWLLAAAVEFLWLPSDLRALDGLDGIGAMSPVRLLLTAVGSFAVLTLLSRYLRARGERYALAGAFALLAAAALTASFSWAFLGVCVLVLGILLVFARRGWNGTPALPEGKCARRGAVWITAALAALFFGVVSLWTVCRVGSFSAPTYDFGIFSQMFFSMQESGLPMTTLERDGLLSHFAVHVSPIYYLMLPFYWLFPTPATLQVLQAAVMVSAVIPLWKLGGLHGLPGWQRCLLCAALLLHPAFSGGAGYDLHENCYLTPLILWLLYGLDRKNGMLTAIAALLTLMVKEDAAVYVAVAGLYAAVRAGLHRERWGVRTGLLLMGGAVVWFLGVTTYLAKSGDGVMTGRYRNFMYDGSDSLLAVIKAVLLCPMKAVYECVDAEKLRYIALTMLPLLGLPLLTRRFERYILLIPYMLVNLMSDYSYQHDIFFQYSFGSLAFLIYLMTVNLADIRIPWRRAATLVAAVGVCAGGFGALIVPKATYYVKLCVQNDDRYDRIRQTLSTIPEDADVAASTFYTVYLSRRETLYDVGYASRAHLLSAEYVVLSAGEKDFDGLTTLLEANGYYITESLDNIIVIYRKAQQ